MFGNPSHPRLSSVGLDDPESKENGNFVVFDFGGATLDVSVLEVENGPLTLQSTVTNFEIGGDLVDQKLIDHFQPNLIP